MRSFSVKELEYINYILDYEKELYKQFKNTLENTIGINEKECNRIRNKLNKEMLNNEELDLIKSFIRIDNHMNDVGNYSCILNLDERNLLNELVNEMKLLYKLEQRMRCKNGKENI
jgi:hypothetical protein